MEDPCHRISVFKNVFLSTPYSRDSRVLLAWTLRPSNWITQALSLIYSIDHNRLPTFTRTLNLMNCDLQIGPKKTGENYFLLKIFLILFVYPTVTKPLNSSTHKNGILLIGATLLFELTIFTLMLPSLTTLRYTAVPFAICLVS